MIVVAGKQPGTRVYGIPGYIVVEIDGKSTQYSIARILRAADIPMLTYEQVSSITTLANLIVVLVRTLIARGVLDTDFLEEGEFDLDFIRESLENMGGSYDLPDLNVTE